jgi:putative SOS response-associated peptidase YedK
MCGRYRISREPAQIAGEFHIKGPLPNFQPRWNAAPTDKHPVVLLEGDPKARHLEPLRWGLIPFWAKDAKIGYSTINAMAESIQTRPAFKEAFQSRRCIVPADGFYEWKKLGPKEKQPYHIGMADGSLFAFAGLWERWRDKASGETVRSFTIVTTTPNDVCAPIHDRMPVILEPANYGKWLGEEPTDPMRLLMMLKPYPAEAMTAYPIGQRVGNVKNDDAGLIEPLPSV